MILTTNKNFEESGGVVGDEVMAAAMLNRLLRRCHAVNIQSASYRMQEYSAARAQTRRNAEKGIKLTKVGHLNLPTTIGPASCIE